MCVSYILTEFFKYEILTKLLPTAKLGGFILYCYFISTVASYGLFASLSTFLKQDMGRYLQPILKHMLETLRSTEGFVVSYAPVSVNTCLPHPGDYAGNSRGLSASCLAIR